MCIFCIFNLFAAARLRKGVGVAGAGAEAVVGVTAAAVATTVTGTEDPDADVRGVPTDTAGGAAAGAAAAGAAGAGAGAAAAGAAAAAAAVAADAGVPAPAAPVLPPPRFADHGRSFNAHSRGDGDSAAGLPKDHMWTVGNLGEGIEFRGSLDYVYSACNENFDWCTWDTEPVKNCCCENDKCHAPCLADGYPAKVCYTPDRVNSPVCVATSTADPGKPTPTGKTPKALLPGRANL